MPSTLVSRLSRILSRPAQLPKSNKSKYVHHVDMEHAYPADELKPLTCSGLCKTGSRTYRVSGISHTLIISPAARDGTTNEHEINDVMGGYSLTLIDALDSFVVLGDVQGFEKAVKLVIDHVSFDIDARVQVFEVTIRVLGGLVCKDKHPHSIRTQPA